MLFTLSYKCLIFTHGVIDMEAVWLLPELHPEELDRPEISFPGASGDKTLPSIVPFFTSFITTAGVLLIWGNRLMKRASGDDVRLWLPVTRSVNGGQKLNEVLPSISG